MKIKTDVRAGIECSGQWHKGVMFSTNPWRLFLNVKEDDGTIYQTVTGTQFFPIIYFPVRGDRVQFSVFNAGTPDAGKVECLGPA